MAAIVKPSCDCQAQLLLSSNRIAQGNEGGAPDTLLVCFSLVVAIFILTAASGKNGARDDRVKQINLITYLGKKAGGTRVQAGKRENWRKVAKSGEKMPKDARRREKSRKEENVQKWRLFALSSWAR